MERLELLQIVAHGICCEKNVPLVYDLYKSTLTSASKNLINTVKYCNWLTVPLPKHWGPRQKHKHNPESNAAFTCFVNTVKLKLLM